MVASEQTSWNSWLGGVLGSGPMPSGPLNQYCTVTSASGTLRFEPTFAILQSAADVKVTAEKKSVWLQLQRNLDALSISRPLRAQELPFTDHLLSITPLEGPDQQLPHSDAARSEQLASNRMMLVCGGYRHDARTARRTP